MKLKSLFFPFKNISKLIIAKKRKRISLDDFSKLILLRELC